MTTLLLHPLLWFNLAVAAPAASSPPSWAGAYSYEEAPVKALAGYSMAMLWTLTLKPQANGLGGELAVEGQQTFMKLKVRATDSAQETQVMFVQGLDGNGYQQLKPGDVLLRLRRDTKGQVLTYWGKLTPRLTEKHRNGQVAFVRK
ncbi:hypothetical protein F0P96_15800 [Hymenobacter busanensis]|uniref:Uncharacterized protein n=1 Tax=Hymenobacter busanensis TaxID=2607656 RepID=A0A7L4ZTT1_9BACT|nr:DUF5991 domain-containing protein [Hymenobacter busanensis]KAA9327447.1 hypothetical protein F0P96_15800 [Hymenobacter busanensis]QHJ06216.1 hypothetical protein GUY19_02440 [Hymenobacter busanensis]